MLCNVLKWSELGLPDLFLHSAAVHPRTAEHVVALGAADGQAAGRGQLLEPSHAVSLKGTQALLISMVWNEPMNISHSKAASPSLFSRLRTTTHEIKAQKKPRTSRGWLIWMEVPSATLAIRSPLS